MQQQSANRNKGHQYSEMRQKGPQKQGTVFKGMAGTPGFNSSSVSGHYEIGGHRKQASREYEYPYGGGMQGHIIDREIGIME